MDSKLSVKEAMEALKVSERTIYRMMESGRLSGQKGSKEWRFEQSAIQACKPRRRSKPLTTTYITAPKGYLSLGQFLQELPITSRHRLLKDIKTSVLPAFRYSGQARSPYFIARRDADQYKKRYDLVKVDY